MENKTIYLHGEFGYDITSDVVIPQIDSAIADKVKILTFDISSIGGSVKTGREIMGAIDRAKLAGIQIETRCLSFAYSMGANLFLMGTKGMRKLSEHAELMIHPAMGMAEGNAKEMMQVAATLQEMSDNLLSYIIKGNEANSENITAAFESAKMIGASEAIELGLADGYVEKLQAVAYFENKIDMKKENIEEAKGLIAFIKDSIKSMFKAEVKNLATTAGDTTLYSEGALSVGTKVFSDEAMTTATADGTYGDYTVSGGEVTAIASEATDSVEDLTAKITDLTTQLNAIKAEKLEAENKIAAAELEKVENKKAIDAMMLKVEELGKVVLGEEGRHKDDDKNDTPKIETMSAKMKRLDAENKAKYLNIN